MSERFYVLIPSASVTQLMVSLSNSMTKSQLRAVFGTYVVVETDRPTHVVFESYPVYNKDQARLMAQYATYAEWEAYVLG